MGVMTSMAAPDTAEGRPTIQISGAGVNLAST
jgi:hypothetical protein